MSSPDLLVLGCGHAGRAIARAALASGQSVLVTVRSPEKETALAADGIAVLRADALDASIHDHVGPHTQVVITFPPDGATDARVAPALRGAAAVTYISTTGVYPALAGRIDDTTPIETPPSERSRPRLDAEQSYLAVGGTVLRCPGIYGPDRGLHVRVVRGQHRIPGDGSRCLSRIHVEDLAQLVLAARATSGRTFVVGDLAPAPHIDVVRWICAAYGVPLPPCVPLDEVHVSLRGDRRVDPSGALETLGVTLIHPSYETGMAPATTGLRAAR